MSHPTSSPTRQSNRGVRFYDFFEDPTRHALDERSNVQDAHIANTLVYALAIDSRQIETGTLFFALKGSVALGVSSEEQDIELQIKLRDHIQSALDQDAALILSEVPAIRLGLAHEFRIVYVADLRDSPSF